MRDDRRDDQDAMHMYPAYLTLNTTLDLHPHGTSLPSSTTHFAFTGDIMQRARRAENTGLFGPSFLRDTSGTRYGKMRSTETDSKSSVHESSR